MKRRFTFTLAVLFALTCGYVAHAQSPPLTPGTVINVSAPMACPSDFSSTMTAAGTQHCHTATLHCAAQGVSNVPDIGLTFGVEGPSTASTVVFLSGGPGSLSDSDINQYVDHYFSVNGFQVVQVDWATT